MITDIYGTKSERVRQVLAHRYDQLDLHDARRVAERWWALLKANSVGGLSRDEVALLEAFGIIMSRIRADGADAYHIVDPQLRLWGEDGNGR